MKTVWVADKVLKDWHRVYYTVSQVERSLRPEEIKVGMELAVLEQRDEFTREIPKPVFYAGRVTRVGKTGEDPLVEVTYNKHPFAKSVVMGRKYIAKYSIPVGKPQQ